MRAKHERDTIDGLFDLEQPPYSVPSMAEVLARDNGLTAVSTFSGCGGSSMGLHMAGWRIPYAVEFIPAARETYQANFPETYVDGRDVRLIKGAEILERIGLERGELDLLEGSPPCSSFSSANTSKASQYGAGKLKDYSEGVKQVTDDLFDEWLRLADELRPRALLAENVPGLLGDGSSGYYREILDRLLELGYTVDADISNAQHFGSATSRRRLIIRAVRKDVGPTPRRPPRLEHAYTLGEALSTLPVPIPDEELAHASIEGYAVGKAWHTLELGQSHEKYLQLVRCDPDRPLPSITATGKQRGCANPTHPTECRAFTPTELAWVFGFPADFTLTGKPSQRYERIGRAVAPPMYEAHGRALAAALTKETR